MSQPTVTSYFATRKRTATDDLRAKSKVLILERDNPAHEVSRSLKSIDEASELSSTSPKLIYAAPKLEKAGSAIRNLQFDARSPKMTTRARATRSRKVSAEEGQLDIRESFLKKSEPRNVTFEKKGMLSPRKASAGEKTAEKAGKGAEPEVEAPAAGSVTPKKSLMDRIGR